MSERDMVSSLDGSERWFACTNPDCSWDFAIKVTCDECHSPLSLETLIAKLERLRVIWPAIRAQHREAVLEAEGIIGWKVAPR